MSTDSSFDAGLAEALFEAAVDGIIVIDRRGSIRAANAAAQRAFGYSLPELLGRNVSMLMPPRDAERHDGYIAHHQQTGERRIIGIGREVVGRRSDGSDFPLYLSIGQYGTPEEPWYVGICHDATERQQHVARIAHLAHHDTLTGVLNRHRYTELLEAHLTRAQASRSMVAVLFIELDGMKPVNDRHGHRAGDAVLLDVTRRLSAALGERAVLGRVGDDEFGVILPELAAPAEAQTLAERLCAALAEPFRTEACALEIGASIGISLYPEHGEQAETLMQNADLALYQARRTGEDVLLFETSLRQRIKRRYTLLEQLERAQALGQLSLHYQPQFDVHTLQVCGLEALMRWHTPQDGNIPPVEFIPLAIEHGLMPQLTVWAIGQACRDNARLRELGLLDAPVAVNVCLPSLAEPGFVERIGALLNEVGLPADRLEIEITEDVAMGASRRTLQHANALHALGVHLAMDDFGVGFSSLGRLKSLHFSKLKIDRGFVTGLPQDASDRAIVKSICGIAAGLDMRVLAEGVETLAQLEYLRETGCQQAQGYWYARPMPMSDLQRFLQRRQRAG